MKPFDLIIEDRILHVDTEGYHGAFVVTNWPAEWPMMGEPGIEGGWQTVAQLIEEAQRHTREAVERAEYEALTEYQRGAYDCLGQRGELHAVCLAAARAL